MTFGHEKLGKAHGAVRQELTTGKAKKEYIEKPTPLKALWPIRKCYDRKFRYWEG